MHFTATTIVTLALAASARADFWFAKSSGMRPGCGGAYCAGNPVTSDTYVYHSGQEADICGEARGLGDKAASGTNLCDKLSSLDEDICGRKVVFTACTEVKSDEPFAGKHFADVLDADGNKIGECHGADSETKHEAVTCANWGSEVMNTWVYCRTEGHDHHKC
ncbi:hypothetical protein FDECE_3726 [Fusarium decemcellulare]|nr:hypothetical protein FDECE_3726 [Fusarium decemcellulare]